MANRAPHLPGIKRFKSTHLSCPSGAERWTAAGIPWGSAHGLPAKPTKRYDTRPRELACQLALFYTTLHKPLRRQCILEDIYLRNFLLHDSVYGTGFECCLSGACEENIGRLFAFVHTYDLPSPYYNRACVDLFQESM